MSVDVFEFSEYRSYLNSWMELAKSERRSSWRQLAEVLSVSTTFVSQVSSGQRDLSLEHALELSRYFGLVEMENEYFLAMVQHDDAGTESLRQYFSGKISEIKSRSQKLSGLVNDDRVLSDEVRAKFYSNWSYIGVWVLSSIPEYQFIDKMSERLNLSPEKVHHIVEFLVRHGICIKTGDRISHGAKNIHLDADSIHISKHHSSWRQKAMEASIGIREDELMFSGPLSISECDFQVLRKLSRNFIKKVVKIVSQTEPEIPAVFNLDLFRIEKSR